MRFTVFFSWSISPETSTVTFCERSPLATAVVTWAMLRTWPVRLRNAVLTESVRSFQVPAAPCTVAWPPSSPSTPTSRATRVTSAPNAESWSTMVLTVFFSSSISPETSTVTFCERSPLATAVVTCAMSRTCVVRFRKTVLTESVRSFQVPAAPGTLACPPSWPSTPTSRATRVTSSAKVRSVSVIWLMVSASWATSPRALTVTLRERSPLATAVVTWAIPRTCAVRLEAMRFTESVRSFHTPSTPGTRACPPSSPSVPTSRATRVTSEENDDSWSTIVLTVFLSSSISPATCTVTLRDRSPRATAVVTSAMSRTCAVSRYAMVLTESVRSFHEPDMPRTCAWPPSLPSVPTSLATRVTSSVNRDNWSTRLLTVRPTFRNSPRSGCPEPSGACVRSSIRCSRSPSATAESTRPTSETGWTRSSTSALDASIAEAQEPSQTPVSNRSVSFPSRPTVRRTRDSSPVRCRLRSATSLNNAATSAITPSPVTVRRRRKLPSRIAARADFRRWSWAASTSTVPPLEALRDRPPCPRVVVLRAAAPDSTVSLPQGSTYCRFARAVARSIPSVSPRPNQAITVRQLRTPSAHPPDQNRATGIRRDREGK